MNRNVTLQKLLNAIAANGYQTQGPVVGYHRGQGLGTIKKQ